MIETDLPQDQKSPWSVSMLERPQLLPYFVCRQTDALQWEQLLGDLGIARFETMGEAQHAADAANAAAIRARGEL